MSARACHNGAAGGRACQSQHRRAGLALAVDFGRSCQRRNSCAFPDILRADEPLLNGRYERWVEECKGASGDLLAYVRQARTHRSRCWGIYKTALSIVMALEQSIQAGTLDLKTTRELADLFAAALSTIELGKIMVQVRVACAAHCCNLNQLHSS